MAELLSSPKVRRVIMEFWNSDVPAIETDEIKTAKTALKAVHDCDLVGKVKVIEKQGKVYLINNDIYGEAKDTSD